MTKPTAIKPKVNLFKFSTKEQRVFSKSEMQFISKIGMLEKSDKQTAIRIFNQYLLFKPDARKIYRNKVGKMFRYKKVKGKRRKISYKIHKPLIPFSKKYGTFDNWLKQTSSNKNRQQKIIRQHIKHPDKSLGEIT